MKKDKKKKKKIKYIDDGSTVVDMSGVGRSNPFLGSSQNGRRQKPRATFKSQFKTYMKAVRMMFVPMLVVMAIITVAFLIVYLIL